MAVIVPDIGLLNVAKHYSEALSGNQRVRLFSNNYTPDETTVWADLTEATFTGYAAVNPGAGALSWDAGAEKERLTFTGCVFTMGVGAPETIYGWVLLDDDLIGGSNQILMVSRLALPVVFGAPGDTITVTAVLSFHRG